MIASRPPGFKRAISFRNARCREAGGTCIQTVLRRMKSNETPSRCTFSRPGNRSLIKVIPEAPPCSLWALGPHLIGRLDSDYLMPERSQPGGIAFGTGAHIKDESGLAWEKARNQSLIFSGSRRFVAIYHFAGVEVVPGDGVGGCRNGFVFGHCFLFL
jgi:hypothetical protein